MTEGMTHGPSGQGDGRLEAEGVRPAYGLPTWFPEDSGLDVRPEMSERATNWRPPSAPIRRRPLSAREYAEEVNDEFRPLPRRPRPVRRRPAPFDHVARAAAAGALSVLIGALSALVVYDITSGGSVRATITSILFGTPQPAGSADSSTTTIVKKVVATARVDALDVTGRADVPIPLSLKAVAGEPDQSIALKLSGLPRDAYLTAGTKLDSNNWLLKSGEELGVKLVVPEAPPLPLSLAVAAIETGSGELVAPVREFKVAVVPKPAVTIEPANAPPEGRTDFAVKQVIKQEVKQETPPASAALTVATPVPEPQGEAADLITRGDLLMAAGEFVAARAFYDRALETGAIQAALKLGQTYDPEVFAEHQVRGLTPDPAQALKYYAQAAAGGVPEAQAAIGRLGKQ